MQNYLDAALQYHAAGLRIIPFWKDESGAVKFPSWAKYREAQTEEEIKELFSKDADGVALVCTDGLEAVDIDVKHDPQKGTAAAIDKRYFEHVGEFPGGADLLKKCVIQKTKSGGWHIIYRAKNAETNQKLAKRKGQTEAVLETRGPGKGLLYIAPSPGYSIEQGDLKAIPEITDEERDILILAARDLDEREDVFEALPAAGGPDIGDVLPGDDFNRRHDVLDVLEGYGWRVVKKAGDRVYLNRPGNPEPNKVNASVLSTMTGERVFYPFTTATKFAPDKCYSAFAVYTFEEHRGDFSAAARALRADGYGSPANSVWPGLCSGAAD